METLPGMQSGGDSVSGIGYEQYQTYPPTYANAIQNMEAEPALSVSEGVEVQEQAQQTNAAGEFPPDAAPGQTLLAQTAGEGTIEPDATEPLSDSISQTPSEQEAEHGKSEPHVSVPSEEQQASEPLEQPKLPPSPNSEDSEGPLE